MYLTKRQKEILDFVTNYINSRGHAPTIEEIRQHFHLSSLAPVRRLVKLLEKNRDIKTQAYQGWPIEPPTNKQLTNDLLAFEADHVWINENTETLLDRYADQWIAVKESRVIASDPDFSTLLRKLPDPANTCVEFITRERVEMIL